MKHRLFLASSSPRRRELLQQLGLSFEMIVADVVEQPAAGESPVQYVSRVARDKARAALARLPAGDRVLVLGADTEVVLDGEIFGKPADAATATAMLQRLAGRTHEVISAFSLLTHEREEAAVQVSRVSFAALGAARIDAYVATGEWSGKAGGYAIQGRAAAFITHLDGSYSGVMGLPLHAVAELLARYGEP